MDFWQNILQILDAQMQTPPSYGWFHILFCVLTVLIAVVLCIWHKRSGTPDRARKIVLTVAVIVSLLEIYKQINYSFSYEDGITFDFQWYAFPWQFCSMPMYIGLLAGLTKKGRFHESMCAFLATYSVFAGTCVMIYPNDVFIDTIGINIQTMICHGSMVTIGIYLFGSGYVKLQHKTILKALPVFSAGVLLAVIANELAYYTGLLETETFNMFYISRHCAPSLPVYSLVQAVVPYPWCLLIYIAAFTLAAYLILLIAMGIGAIVKRTHKEKAAI